MRSNLFTEPSAAKCTKLHQISASPILSHLSCPTPLALAGDCRYTYRRWVGRWHALSWLKTAEECQLVVCYAS